MPRTLPRRRQVKLTSEQLVYARRVIVAGKARRMTHLRLQRDYQSREAAHFSDATTKSATARNLSESENRFFGLVRNLGR
jgi:hypothetical protein